MMTISVEDLSRPVSDELALFRREFAASFQSDVGMINDIAAYILDQKSKHIRPLLVLLSARLCGTPTDATIVSASLVELLHTATLIHDDIIDESITRRGVPSVNAVWQNKVSVLMGDFLFSRSLTNMLKLRNYKALELLSKTSEALSSGEIMQLAKSSNNGMDEESYFRMIWLKTASLFASSCKVGALSVGSNAEQAEALGNFGKYLGMAFQIKDDLFDYTAKEDKIGKPIGRDLKSNLITLPLLYVLNRMGKAESVKIRADIRKGLHADEVKKINTLVFSKGGIRYTEDKLNEISEKAEQTLEIFPDSEVKKSLIGFIAFNRQRSS
ncbi:MAG: polyprenyl synthetase family protein [Candidatus Marinimicrobia bacterium]|nr:polyprenyl synthetase family protein [Candidatus Neomarinimicrobiota bacterium]